MSALIPFEKAQLPADLAALFGAAGDDDLSGGVGAGFPSISIKGKVFHLKRGGERTLIENPKEPGSPATSLDTVILKANPTLSKLYYKSGYVEGSDDKPVCYSDDGVAPAADAEEPQSQKCATCPHAQWGSKITENGKKSKECQDSRRIAVAPLGQLEDAMLLRVPAASLKPLKLYGDEVKKRGLRYFAVGTKIGFDHTVAHPLLTFKPLGALPESMLRQVAEMMNGDLVNSILGLDSTPVQDEFSAPYEATAAASVPAAQTPTPTKPPVPRAAATAAAAAKPTRFTTASVEKPETAAPVPVAAKTVAAKATPAKPAAKPAAAPVVVDIAEDFDSQIDAMLSGAGFEDDDGDDSGAE